MRVYRSIWLALWATVVLFGVGLGFLIWSPIPFLTMLTIAATLVAMVSIGFHRSDGPSPLPRAESTRLACTRGAFAGLGLVAIAAIGSVAPTLLVPVLVLAVATSPWVAAFCAGRSGALDLAPTVTDEPALAMPMTSAVLVASVVPLSDRELCRAWRASFDALQTANSARSWEQIVALRQVYLDEIERRNPCVLNAWLASEPRAAGSPDKYFLQAREEGTPDAK
ncbi:MAG: hypothetical protein M3393_03960 [Actinomycetota bacterium]|nr:hypothetical protein [Actinomycetota bacterium]